MKKLKFIIEEVVSKEFEIEVEDEFNLDSEDSWETLEQKISDGYDSGKFVVDSGNVTHSWYQVLDESGMGLSEWTYL